MKKTTEMVSELAEHLESNLNAALYAVSVVMNGRNEVESMAWEKPVCEVFLDHESRELILFVPLTDTDGSLPISGSSFLGGFSVELEKYGSYSVCVSDKSIVDDYTIRTDRPLIGFGESEDSSKFLVVVSND